MISIRGREREVQYNTVQARLVTTRVESLHHLFDLWNCSLSERSYRERMGIIECHKLRLYAVSNSTGSTGSTEKYEKILVVLVPVLIRT